MGVANVADDDEKEGDDESMGDDKTDTVEAACSVSEAAIDRKLVGGACRKDPT